MWRKESSGREWERSEFSCPSAVSQGQVKVCPAFFMGNAVHTHIICLSTVGLIATSLCSKAQVRVKAILIILMNVVMDLIPSSHRSESKVVAKDRL